MSPDIEDDRAALYFILYDFGFEWLPDITHRQSKRVYRVKEHLVALNVNQSLLKLPQCPIVGEA